MRARTAVKTGLSLTIEPHAEQREIPDQTGHRLARQFTLAALLVSAAAIAGYLAGPGPSSGPSPPPGAQVAQVIEGDAGDELQPRRVTGTDGGGAGSK